MPRKKKIVLTTNPPWIFTGLAESGKFLLQWLYKTGKYDLVHYCSQTSVADPNHGRQPWKSRGCIPADQQTINQLNADPYRAKVASYGGLLIEQVVKEEQPDIFWGSDDVWSYPGAEFFGSSWWSKIHSILHITVDSVPILDQAYQQARSTPHFYTWAKFAQREMARQGQEYAHVKQIYGATNVRQFEPLSQKERQEIRRQFKIDPDVTVFGYTGRNQLRKEFLNALKAFADLKKEMPALKIKFHAHTSWSETSNGWNFPQWIKYLGVDPSDVLCTYVCRNCSKWHVAPYVGEDQDCHACHTQKSMVSSTIAHGVPGEEMKYLYAVRDATISPMTSGGLEYENVNSLLSGIPLATTNYSAGEDFCEQSFVSPIKWHFRAEAGTSFLKATNDIQSIKDFMLKVIAMSDHERCDIGERGRDWATRTFSIETIGPQWEAVFDSLPPKDWSSISLTPTRKNDQAANPQIQDPQQWITQLYRDILLCEPDPDGLKNWLATLERGTPRDQVYQYFLQIARQDNAKSEPPKDFSTLLDMKTGRKRGLLMLKESLGDSLELTRLLASFHEQYPGHDLYIGTDPKHNEVFEGNPHVFRVIPYHPAMEQELAMIGAGQSGEPYFHVYHNVAIGSQKVLSYLSASNPALP